MSRKGPFWMLLLALVPGLVHATPVVTEAAAPIAGGWQPAPIEESVQEIARFALAERQPQEAQAISLQGVREASRQVVAGLNFRLQLRVKRGGRVREASATVYQDLQGQRRLIAWEWQPCRSSHSNRTGVNP